MAPFFLPFFTKMCYNKCTSQGFAIVHRVHLLVRLRRTRSIGRLPDVESWRKTVLQASLTTAFFQLSTPCELWTYRSSFQ